MTNDEFRMWIKGYIQLTPDKNLNHRQFTIIKNHANLVQSITGQLDHDIDIFLERIESKLTNNNQISLSLFTMNANKIILI